MSMFDSNTQAIPGAAAAAPSVERQTFIRRTYAHLFAAILAFIGVEAAFFVVLPVEQIAQAMFGSGWSWLLVLGVFMGVSWLARSWASSGASTGVQYAGLGLYVVAQAAIFMPILWIASQYYPGVISSAGLTTVAVFAGLTGFVWITGADFSWMRGILAVGGIAAMVVIVAALLIGFELGMLFTVLMIALAAGYIVYDTSNVLHHYRTDQHVAASLALFASVALLFWYILRLYMLISSRE